LNINDHVPLTAKDVAQWHVESEEVNFYLANPKVRHEGWLKRAVPLVEQYEEDASEGKLQPPIVTLKPKTKAKTKVKASNSTEPGDATSTQKRKRDDDKDTEAQQKVSGAGEPSKTGADGKATSKRMSDKEKAEELRLQILRVRQLMKAN
jgi:hypothetical protein